MSCCICLQETHGCPAQCNEFVYKQLPTQTVIWSPCKLCTLLPGVQHIRVCAHAHHHGMMGTTARFTRKAAVGLISAGRTLPCIYQPLLTATSYGASQYRYVSLPLPHAAATCLPGELHRYIPPQRAVPSFNVPCRPRGGRRRHSGRSGTR